MAEDSPKATESIDAEEVDTSSAASHCSPVHRNHSLAVVVAPGLGLPPLRNEAEEAAICLGRTNSPLTRIGEELKLRRQQGTPAKELHLLAHGNSQGIQLADDWIDQAALLRHAADIAEWQISTLVLWCCQIGRNQAFINQLRKITGAEIFVSDNHINKEAIKTHNEYGDTHQLSELIENNQLQTWQGDLEWLQVGDEIEGRKKNARSGSSVSLSSDGSIAAIGSWNDRTIGKQRGSVAVYQSVNNSWTQLGNILNGDNNYDRFGGQVSLSADGSRLAVGTTRDDDGGVWAGSVSIYELQSGTWTKLGSNIDGVSADDRAGVSLALSGDGSTVIIGAERGHTQNRGYAGIYEWDGTSWDQVGSLIKGTQKKEYSGRSVAISEDGSRVAIGSWAWDTSGVGNDTGRVRVYDNIGGTWTKKFEISGEKKKDFASSVSLSDNGNILAFGANGNDGAGNNSGHARVYDISGSSEKQLGNDINGQTAGQELGATVSLSSNGQRLAVGAPKADGAHSNSGRVTIFDYDSSSDSWTKVGSRINGVGTGDASGSGVTGLSLSGDGETVAIGARFHDGDTNALKNAGHVRVFAASGLTVAQTGSTDGSGNLLTTEAGSTSTFTVVLDAKPTANVTVSITGADSTEHSLSSSSLTFTTANWNTAQTITVTGVDDSLDDGDITTTLTATASNSGGYAGSEKATTTLKTSDNDTAGITIAQTGSTDGSGNLLTTEAGSTSTFTVVLDAKPTANVTVSITGADSTEHSLSSSSLTFTAANWNTAQTITVTGVDDSLDDGDITTTLTATASNSGGYAGSETATTTLKTSDNDTAGITIAQTGSTDGSGNLLTTEAGSTSTFTVVLDAQPTANVTVNLTGADSTEHSLSSSSLTFTAANWDTAQTITVTGVDDSLDDSDITTTLTATASNSGGYAGTETATTTVKNTDNDSAGITIAQTGSTDGSGNLLTTEAGSTSTFTVVLDAKPTANVTVSITGADSTEHSLSSSSLTFTAANWNTAQTITITGANDAIVDGDITTTLTAIASNSGGYAGTETATTTIKNTDDDSAGITIAQTGSTDGSGNLLTTEAGSTSTFTVVLDAKPTANVTVSITGADSTEHSLSSSSLTFTAANWNTAQTITVTGVDDNLDDGDIITTLTATASNTGGYAGTETATTTIKNTDNDSSGISIAQTGTTDGSGNLLTTEAGGSSAFSIVLDNEPTANVTVTLTGADSTEHSLSSSSLTFTTANWDTAQTITITGVDDNLDDGDITTTLTATASNTGGFSGSKAVSTIVKNADNDSSGITIAQTGTTDGSGNLLTTEAGGSSTFTVVLDAQPTANVTVTLTGADSTEHSLSSSSLTFTTANWDTAQTVTITGVDENLLDGDITTTLTATASNTGGYAGTETATTTVKTTDNETAGITIAQTGTTDGSGNLLTTEAGGSSTFTVVLDAQPTADVTVTLTGADSTEHSLSSSSLTFTADNWNTAQTITVTGANDSLVDGDITTTLTATASNTGGYAGTETATTTVKTTDNETAGITIAQTGTTDGSGNLLTTEAGSTSTFTVVLDAKPTADVTVTLTGADSTEHSLSSSSLTFTTANWNTAQTVTVTGVDDNLQDGDITTTLTATASNTGGYAGTETANTTAKNTDNDNPPSISDQSEDVLENISSGSEILDLNDNTSSNDTDKDGDSITYSITDGNDLDLFEIESSTGKILLAAGKSLDHDKSDLHTLEISATDGTLTTTAEISINVIDVNNAPVAEADSGSVNENETLNITAASGLILSNDTDEDGDSLVINSFHAGVLSASSPRVGQFNTALDGDFGQLTLQTDGSFSYIANKSTADALAGGETESDIFSYRLSDGKLTDSTELTITITGVNDDPFLVDAIKTKKYIEGQGNVIVIDGSLDIRDIDDTNIESATVTISSDTYVSSEDQLAFTNAYGVSGSWNSTTGVLTLSGSTTKANYVSALQTVTYTNTDDADPVIGARTIDWVVNDGDTSSAGIQSKIIVGGRNDAPSATNETASVDAGSTVATPTQTNLLANDTDPESHTLSITSFRAGNEQESNVEFAAGATLTGTYGQMTIESNGTYSYIAQETAAQKLLEGETATETFTYKITDSQSTDEGIDTGEITITITGINDSPTAINDDADVNEDSSKLFDSHQGILKNDTDIDGDKLFIKSIKTGEETSGGSFSREAIGSELKGTYGSLIVNSDGSYRFTANNADKLDAGDKEIDNFSYTLTDLANEDSANIKIQVTGVNDAPTLSSITRGTVTDQENSTSISSTNLTGQLIASDPDESAVLEYGISSGSTTSTVMNGSYGRLNVNSSTGAYTYTPDNAAVNNLAADQTVTESFTLYASDGTLTSSQNFDITVSGAKDTTSSADSETSDEYVDALIGSLSNEKSSTTNQFSNFLTSADSFLIASNDLSILKLQTSNSELFDSKEGVTGTEGTQPIQWDQLASFNLNNGVRVMLPNFSLTDWEDTIPNQRAGEIPIFISLLKQPDQDTKVQLQAKTLPATLSTNTLHFTPKNWDQPQIVWANLNNRGLGETISTLDIAISLQSSNNPGQIQTEIFSISLPKANELTLEGFMQASDDTSPSDSENPNIDLELSTVKEEESPAFLLLRAALSPFILITSMAIHSIKQINGVQTNGLRKDQKDNQPSNEITLTTELPKESNQIDSSFEKIDLTPQQTSPETNWESFLSLQMAPTISSLDADQNQSTIDLW
ncbi:putative cadherin domain-containing protein [Synechococcus sp. MIT S9220]|uniref:VCBS domain-containing protein n=1 Tax=Synechococcus sp. MIT S9220 TaxID=166309 RepID=UPI00164AF6A9|nr:Ig-like domain-containing protein [Synechococcus sp. MIT S9220]QNJ24252.1 putative cadherin domain-containing protein [Synechococcus sp. MIT S9220]